MSPSLTITATASPTIICSGASATLTATGAASYTWSANAGSVTTSTASVNPTSNDIYTVTASNGTCSSSQTVAVTVNTFTLLANANPIGICNGQSAILTASGASTYTWSANAGGATTATVSVSPSTTSTYIVSGTSGVCTQTQTISVTVNTPPVITISASSSTLCSGQSSTLTANGAATYTWDANAGSATTSTVNVSPSATNIYTVTGANGGCQSMQTISISVTPTPTLLAVVSNSAICSDSSVVLTASGASTYQWDANAGNAITATVTVTPLSSIVYTVTGSNGACSSTQTVSVMVNPTPTISVSGSYSVCNGQTTTLTAQGATTYSWSPGLGLSSTNSPTVTASPLSNTTYTVFGISFAGCPSQFSLTLSVVPIPPRPTVKDTIFYCQNQMAFPLTASVTPGDVANWYLGSQSFSIAPIPSTSAIGTTTYFVSQSLGGCASPFDTVDVVVVAAPNASISTSPSMPPFFSGQTLQYIPGSQSPYFVYYWNFGDSTSASTNTSALASPSHTYPQAGNYCTKLVIYSTQTGCRDSSILCNDFLGTIGIVVPNIFTPNGDNINDVFSLKTVGIENLTCNIFDRWGVELFTFTGPTGSWDGIMKDGKVATEGCYYYIVQATDVKGQSHAYNGSLMLMK